MALFYIQDLVKGGYACGAFCSLRDLPPSASSPWSITPPRASFDVDAASTERALGAITVAQRPLWNQHRALYGSISVRETLTYLFCLKIAFLSLSTIL